MPNQVKPVLVMSQFINTSIGTNLVVESFALTYDVIKRNANATECTTGVAHWLIRYPVMIGLKSLKKRSKKMIVSLTPLSVKTISKPSYRSLNGPYALRIWRRLNLKTQKQHTIGLVIRPPHSLGNDIYTPEGCALGATFSIVPLGM